MTNIFEHASKMSNVPKKKLLYFFTKHSKEKNSDVINKTQGERSNGSVVSYWEMRRIKNNKTNLT